MPRALAMLHGVLLQRQRTTMLFVAAAASARRLQVLPWKLPRKKAAVVYLLQNHGSFRLMIIMTTTTTKKTMMINYENCWKLLILIMLSKNHETAMRRTVSGDSTLRNGSMSLAPYW